MHWLPKDPLEWFFMASLLVYLIASVWLSWRRKKQYREARRKLIEEFEANQKNLRNGNPK